MSCIRNVCDPLLGLPRSDIFRARDGGVRIDHDAPSRVCGGRRGGTCRWQMQDHNLLLKETVPQRTIRDVAMRIENDIWGAGM